MGRNRMMDYVRGLSAYQGSRYDNSYIGRLTYARWKEETADTVWTIRTVKHGTNVECLQVQAVDNGEMIGVLEAWIFLAAFPKHASPAARHEGHQGNLWRSFTRDEVIGFAYRTGDMNPIHLTSQPVVQGMYLFSELGKSLGDPDFLSVKFQAPVHTDEPVYLKEERAHESRRHFANYCSRSFQKCLPSAYHDYDCSVCRAFSSVGVHFFSAAFYPGHGDSTDHNG